MDSEKEPIKNIFYDEIKNQDPKKIQKFIQEKKSNLLIEKIIKNTEKKLKKISNDETFGTFTTVLLHYFLTNCAIPTQRKVKHENTDIDIVIPDLGTLKKTPNDALIIAIPKTGGSISEYLKKLENIQKNKKNIWVVFEKKQEIPYQIFDKNNISEIINEIEKFLLEHNIKRLKILKTGF